MATYKSKDFRNVKPAYGHESDGLVKASFLKYIIYYIFDAAAPVLPGNLSELHPCVSAHINVTLAIDE